LPAEPVEPAPPVVELLPQPVVFVKATAAEIMRTGNKSFFNISRLLFE
jgi:hypothetical protein